MVVGTGTLNSYCWSLQTIDHSLGLASCGLFPTLPWSTSDFSKLAFTIFSSTGRVKPAMIRTIYHNKRTIGTVALIHTHSPTLVITNLFLALRRESWLVSTRYIFLRPTPQGMAMANSFVRTLASRSGYYRYQQWACATLPLAAATTYHLHYTTSSKGSPTRNDASPNSPKETSEKPNSPSTKDNRNTQSFDISNHWKSAQSFLETFIIKDDDKTGTDKAESDSVKSNQTTTSTTNPQTAGFLGFLGSLSNTVISGNNNTSTSTTTSTNESQKEKIEFEQNLRDVQSSLMGLLTGQTSQKSFEELIAKARNSTEQGDVSDSVSLEEVMKILKTVAKEFDQTFQRHLEGRDLPPIYPTSLYYFLEYEDERKNFSWRRRKHRFCPGINIEYVTELNRYMHLAELGYSTDMNNIQQQLRNTFGYELIYCNMDSLPNQPSHFVAIKKDQSHWSSTLDIMLCVRGTATVTDVITDLLADEVEYRGGKAHSGICKSGKYLVEKHKDTLLSLLKESGKKKIRLTLIGHSLGAGAASIAGMEFQDLPEFEVSVIGFGCPALVSKELSESAKSYITTIVSDNDCIPRMSLATMINAILDIGEYNWIAKGRADLEDVVGQIQVTMPNWISDTTKKTILEILDSRVLSSIPFPPPTQERMKPVLFPRTY